MQRKIHWAKQHFGHGNKLLGVDLGQFFFSTSAAFSLNKSEQSEWLNYNVLLGTGTL
jgi:hypothetical protein